MNSKNKSNNLSKFVLILSLTITAFFSCTGNALAKDPFRKENERDIGEHTGKAFETVFLEGDYKTVTELLALAEAEEKTEPLAYAMQASLAYTEEDWDNIKKYALKTLEAAQITSYKDPLRGNLYLAVGHFLDGAYIYEKEGPIKAIKKLQLVFKHFDAAEDIDPNDPEFNLIKGYVDLLLAVNLPFSSPEQAIARFETYAAPEYLVERGLAVAYRDLKQYDKALKYANKAIEEAPDNGEHYYLKGQILRKLGNAKKDVDALEDALDNFEEALDRSEKLPVFVLKTLRRETRFAKKEIRQLESETARKNVQKFNY
ncbi:MAG: Sll0314/Alr1548 family TPR repeat-containing protein [Pleurocapsa sp.]